MRLLNALHVIEFNKKICQEYNIEHVVLNRSLVESAMGSAFFELADVGYVHGEISQIAAALCYKIIKNHAFKDGNKRTAAISALVFLELNNLKVAYQEYADGTELHKIIESVASNDVSEDQLKKWFMTHVKNRAEKKGPNEKISYRNSLHEGG